MTDIFELYDPHPLQAEVHRSNAKEKYLEVARRGGKSRCALGELAKAINDWMLLEMAGKRVPNLIPKFHAWVIVPSDPQGRQSWHEMDELIPKRYKNRVLEDDRMIYLNPPEGIDGYGLIEMKSAYNKDSLQTIGLDFLWVNESQDIQEEAITKVLPAMISPGRMGRMVFEGIPSLYPDHWFRKGAVSKMNTSGSKKAYFHWTAFQNPLLSERQLDEVEEFKEKMSIAAWRRMFLAEFSQSAGFFRNIEACIAADELIEPLSGNEYVGGIDFGRADDATVFIIMDAQKRQVVAFHFFDSMPWPQQRANIQNISEKWGLTRVQVDATSMQRLLAEELASSGIPIELDFKDRPGLSLVGENRENVLKALQIAIERQTVQFPRIPILIRQLYAFQYIQRGSRVRAEAPTGEHDDAVFALALALSVCEDPTPNEPQGSLRSRRYLPTSSEGIIRPSFGQNYMKERRTQRRKEQLERSGLIV